MAVYNWVWGHDERDGMYIAAIRSFDTAHRQMVVPKKYVRAVTQAGGNRGPKYGKHADVRRVAPYGQSVYNKVVHTTAQSVHVLVLTSSVADLGEADAEREKTAQERVGSALKVLWWQQIPRNRFQSTDIDGHARVRVNIRDEYEGPDGRHTEGKRYAYLAGGLGVRDVKMNDNPPETYRAVGCTCTDMVMRGAGAARGGCKHVLYFNKHAASGTVVAPS